MRIRTTVRAGRLRACGNRASAAATLFPAAVLFVALTIAVVAQAANWADTKELVRTDFPEAPQLSVPALAKTLVEPAPKPLLIDVREPEEYAVSHLPGAVNAQGAEVEQLVRDAGAEQPVVLYCSVGYRSSRETENLRRKGFENVSNLEGSIFEWANAGNPLVRGGPESQTPTDVVHPFDDDWGLLLDPERRSYVPR
ncbi:MAG: rhodanese-like domain-containing protein [Pseudomonadota bacterium]